MTTAISANSAVTKVVQFILNRGIEGVPPLSGASDLAQEYLLDQSYADNDNRTASLIRWETAKSFKR